MYRTCAILFILKLPKSPKIQCKAVVFVWNLTPISFQTLIICVYQISNKNILNAKSTYRQLNDFTGMISMSRNNPTPLSFKIKNHHRLFITQKQILKKQMFWRRWHHFWGVKCIIIHIVTLNQSNNRYLWRTFELIFCMVFVDTGNSIIITGSHRK